MATTSNTTFTRPQINTLRLAWTEGHPFAIWRTPNGDTPRAAISLGELQRNWRFEFDSLRPSFAISRFGTADARDCDLVVADLVLEGGGAIRFVNAEGLILEEPTNEFQERAAQLSRTQSADGPALALSTRQGWPENVPTVTGEEHYKRFVREAVEAIGRGELTKIVASRIVPSEFQGDADLLEVFAALTAAYEHAFVCLVSLPDNGVWLLATPEILLSVDATRTVTMALAGTQPIAPEKDTGQVAWTDKFIVEQGLVSQYVRETLLECGATRFTEYGPKTVRAANLAHLRTDFEVRADSGSFGDSDAYNAFCGQLLHRLQPTSAVCGMPRDKARAFIEANEGYERDYYCGYIGPVGFDGRTDLYVNLRSSQIIGNTAFLYVGAGVVSNSSPEEEFLETVEKSKTLGRILWSS